MRLNLYWRGRDVFDVEVHVWKRRADADHDVVVHTGLADTERVDDTEPLAYVHTFGFGRSQ